MRKSKTNNMKRIVTIIICGLSFGATVQLETAEIVARSIYYENSELHDGVKFYVSEIEIFRKPYVILSFHLIHPGKVSRQVVPFHVPALLSRQQEHMLHLTLPRQRFTYP